MYQGTRVRTRGPCTFTHTHTHTHTYVHTRTRIPRYVAMYIQVGCERSQGYRVARKVNPAEWFQQFSLCSGYAHVRLPQLLLYLLSLFLSLFHVRTATFFCPILPCLSRPYPAGGRTHPRAGSKRRAAGRERPTGERHVEKDRENLLTSRIALIFHPCEIASVAHLLHD